MAFRFRELLLVVQVGCKRTDADTTVFVSLLSPADNLGCLGDRGS